MMNELPSDFEPLRQKVRFNFMAHVYRKGGKALFTDVHHAENTSASLGHAHIRLLVDAGYLELHKVFVGKKQFTELVQTDYGRKCFEGYIEAVASAIKPAEAAA